MLARRIGTGTVDVLLGTDVRGLLVGAARPAQDARSRVRGAVESSPLVEPSVSLVEHMVDGHIEGIGLKDRKSTHREAWPFDRR